MGNNMKAERARRGMTQQQVADALNVTQLTVSRWESGDHVPGAKALLALASLYDCSPEYLLDLADDSNRKLAAVTA